MIEISFTVDYVERGMLRDQYELLEELRVFCEHLFNRKTPQYFPDNLEHATFSITVEPYDGYGSSEGFVVTVSYSDETLRRLCYIDQTCPHARIAVEFDDSYELETQVLIPAFESHPMFAVRHHSTEFDYDDPVKYWQINVELVVLGIDLSEPRGNDDEGDEDEEKEDDEGDEDEEKEDDENVTEITLDVQDQSVYEFDIHHLSSNLKELIKEFFESRFTFDPSAIVAVQATNWSYMFVVVLEREKLYVDLVELETDKSQREISREAYLRSDAISALEDDNSEIGNDWYVIEGETAKFEVTSTTLTLDWSMHDILRPFKLKKKRNREESQGESDLD
jgi:hypothetical protein